MSIPLVGSPPPPPNYEDLITGDSRDFAASVGNWAATGGTLTHDTTAAYKWSTDYSGSLKWVSTAQNEYLELAVPGTFFVGKEYQAVVYARTVSNAADGVSWSLDLGLNGVDVSNVQGSSLVAYFDDGYRGLAVRWIPTATRSGVTLRFTRLGGELGTTEWHLGFVRVARVVKGSVGLLIASDTSTSSTSLFGTASGVWIQNDPRYNTSPGMGLDNTSVSLDSGGNAYALLKKGTSYGNSDGVYVSGGSATGSTTNEGINLEVGGDYVGLFIGEKDSSTVQLYPDWSGGYDVELRDRGIGKHWKAIGTDTGRSVVLSKAVENPMTAVDDIIVGTTYAISVEVQTGTGAAHTQYVLFSLGTESVLDGAGTAQIESAFTGPVTVNYNVWLSGYGNPTGASKTIETRLRRTSVTGTQLAIDTWTSSTDSMLGHTHQWTGSYVDASPTDGKYVITVKETAGAAGYNYVLSDEASLVLSATGAGSPTKLSKGSNNDILTISPVTGHVSWQAPGLVGSSSPTGSYTLQLTDAGKVVELSNGSPSTITIPENTSVQFLVGTTIGVYQAGAGQITVSPTGATVLRAAAGTKTRAQYSAAQLRKRETDEWVLSGDVTT